jgi:hypothetical protein
MAHMSSGWLRWAVAAPDKRRALAQLGVSEDITEESREIGHRAMAGVARLLERSRENGPLRDAPLGLVVGLTTAIAEATIDFVVSRPDDADALGQVGFEAMWRILA